MFSIFTNIVNAGNSTERIEELTKIFEGSPYSDLKDWYFVCERDKFNNSRICTLSKDDVMVMVRDGKYSVLVGGNHFPRSKSAIKIDNNATIYGDEGISQTPKKVIEQLKQGKKVFTRYQEWPYQFNRDGETDLTGFSEEFEKMLEQYNQL